MEATVTETGAEPLAIIRALVRQAHDDALAVSEYLSDVQPRCSEEIGAIGAPAISPTILLGLAMVLRLRRWEACGISLPCDASIPTSHAVFDRITSEPFGADLTEFVDKLFSKVLRFSFQHLLWSAEDCDLRAHLAVVGRSDDAFLDAIADFLITFTVAKSANG